MPKLTLRSAIPAFGILIAIGGCAESSTGPVDPAAVRAVVPADAAKPATPESRPRFAYTAVGG